MPYARADDFHLPVPGIMVRLSPEFSPAILKGIKIHPDNPFRFEFILDKGDSVLPNGELNVETSKLVKYFLAGLTIPDHDLWVNLSPYEKDRIIPSSFGLTQMGRDLLAEDYMLKQITASLIYPEDTIGKKFWKRIYQEAAKRYGTTDIAVKTFNKVWIVPQKAVVYENARAGSAYVVESRLKVMLEEDYLSLQKHVYVGKSQGRESNINKLGSDIVREIVIPQLTKEINENKNFSQLRQVYNSLILATWYKNKIKESILGQVYADKKKVQGVGYRDISCQAIYQRYLQAFKKGVYNYIKEESDPLTQQAVPRKYFSGGMSLLLDEKIDYAQASEVPVSLDRAQIVTVDLAAISNDKAMTTPPDAISRVIKDLENDLESKGVRINRRIDPRDQRLPVNKKILDSFINAMDIDENPLVENQRSDYIYNLLLLAVKGKNRGIWDKWIEQANAGLEAVAEENRIENEKYVISPDILRPQLPVILPLDDRYILKIRKDTRWGELDRNAYIIGDIVEKSSNKLAGRTSLGYDQNTTSWLAVEPLGININDDYRGQYLGRKAYQKLVKTLGVIRSAGMTPDVTSPSAQNMWEKMGAGVEFVGSYYNSPSHFVNSLGWSWVIRSDNAQMASGVNRREFIKWASIFTLSFALPAQARPLKEPTPNIYTARKMVLDHLEGLYKEGKIRSDIGSREYWLNLVFKGNDKMYLFGLDDVEIAMEAGFKSTAAGKPISVKEFAAKAIQAIRNQAPEVKLKRFFIGSWSRYMTSLYNNDIFLIMHKEVLHQRAKDIDPLLGEMIDRLIDNTAKWENKDIDTEWQKFNDAYLIPKGYYASVSPAVQGKNNLYFSLIYHIESKEQVPMPGGRSIDVITGRRADNVPFAGDLGTAPKGFDRVFIDLDTINNEADQYIKMTRREILPFTTINFKKLSGIESWLKQIKGRGIINLIEILTDSTKKHEKAHKVYEDFKNVQLSQGFGIFQESFDDLKKENPEGFDVSQSEVYAYLSQTRDSRVSSLVVFKLLEFFMRGTSSPEFYAASFILNQMTGKDLDFRKADETIELVTPLLHMTDTELSQKAKSILEAFFPPVKDQAMVNVQNTGGIDLTAANMNLQSQNIGGAIAFHLDPAMLQTLQNAPGFLPVIISIRPMNDLHRFLGINDPLAQ